ncbi:MAG: cobalamin-dependent protein [Candidatus Hodarchaeota archaeon]
MGKEEMLKELGQIVIEGDVDAAPAKAREVLDAGVTPWECISEGLSKGMEEVGRLYEEHEYFLPEVLLSANTMYAALDVVLPELKIKGGGESPGTVVIGVVEGDIHDIGKNIVKALLTGAGYNVIDKGRNVPADEFLKGVKEEGAQVIAMSTLMTPTLESMREVEDKLKKEGLKEKTRTIIGGAATSATFAGEIGSDDYGEDAQQAVDKVKALVEDIKSAVAALGERVEK